MSVKLLYLAVNKTKKNDLISIIEHHPDYVIPPKKAKNAVSRHFSLPFDSPMIYEWRNRFGAFILANFPIHRGRHTNNEPIKFGCSSLAPYAGRKLKTTPDPLRAAAPINRSWQPNGHSLFLQIMFPPDCTPWIYKRRKERATGGAK